jgi:hypothetical protein
LDRKLADYLYVDDEVILGAVVGHVLGVGVKVEDNVACCVGNGVGPNVDVWDCYDSSGPSQRVFWLLGGPMREVLGWALEIIIEKAFRSTNMWADSCSNEKNYVWTFGKVRASTVIV